MRLVSVVYEEYEPFDNLFPGVECVSISQPNELLAGDVLIFWGGSDISPSLYDRPLSYFGHGAERWQDSWMDSREWPIMQRAKELGCYIIGVCRGAQMLCALAGGTLFQDVEGHHGYHKVYTWDGQEFTANSIHHQQLNIEKTDGRLLAWTKQRGKDYWYTDVDGRDLTADKNPLGVDPEFVYFPSLKGFAIQWHPEMMQEDSAATQYVFNFIKGEMNG